MITHLKIAAQHRAAADERVRQGDEGEPEKVARIGYHLSKSLDQSGGCCHGLNEIELCQTNTR